MYFIILHPSRKILHFHRYKHCFFIYNDVCLRHKTLFNILFSQKQMKNLKNRTFLIVSMSFFALFLVSFQIMKTPKLYPKLGKYVQDLPQEFSQIDEKRQHQLQKIGDYIVQRHLSNKQAKLVVICTHNSRRSHLGHIWLKTAAHYYGVQGIQGFSGGTEATAFNPRAVTALRDVGFKIEKINGGTKENPHYHGSFAPKSGFSLLFSKKYDNAHNPKKEFAAVMVCSEADASCPIVLGADARFAIPYDDPKHFDNTPQEAEKYLERCRQIGREMFFVMDYVKNKLILEAEKAK